MGKIKDNTVVIRGGQVTRGSLENLVGGGDITTGSIVNSLSVQLSQDAGKVTDIALIKQLAAPLPHNFFTVVYAKQLLAVDNVELKFNPIKPVNGANGNPYHGLITGGGLVTDIENVFISQSTVYTREDLGL